jgi:hypothetical protein
VVRRDASEAVAGVVLVRWFHAWSGGTEAGMERAGDAVGDTP